jgi:hypothetical protein
MTLHYDGGRLTRYAAGEADRSVSEHVAVCAACAAEVSRLRAAMDLARVSSTTADVTEQCLTEVVLAAFVAGAADEVERTRCIEHVAACSHCAGVVASIARALATDEIAREVRAVELPSARRWQRALLPLAGAAVLALLLTRPSAQPTHRSAPVTAFAAATLVHPVGHVTEMPPLRWRAVPMADRYRVTLFAPEGVIYEDIVTDTVMVLPDSVPLAAGQIYFWTVAARTGWDRWVNSEMAEFSLQRMRSR